MVTPFSSDTSSAKLEWSFLGPTGLEVKRKSRLGDVGQAGCRRAGLTASRPEACAGRGLGVVLRGVQRAEHRVSAQAAWHAPPETAQLARAG